MASTTQRTTTQRTNQRRTRKTSQRKDQHSDLEPVFRASKKFADRLQRVHVELIDLHLQGKQAHWNVVGKNFRDLHLQLDEVVEAARGFSDEVAERMRALWIVPDGRVASVAEQSGLEPFPDGEVDTAETVGLITARLHHVVGTIREVHDPIDDEDPTTADMLHAVIARLEQLAWMVSAENRTAGDPPLPVEE